MVNKGIKISRKMISFSKELKKGTSLFYKVDGKDNRQKLLETYKVPAEAKGAEVCR